MNFKINFLTQNIQALEIAKPAIAEVNSYDLNLFFKNPWGADTMNITGCFRVFDENMWRSMLTFKDACYAR